MGIKCRVCGKNATPKYRITKEYLKRRKYCSYQCSDKAAKGRPSKRKGQIFTILADRFWSKVKKGEKNECWEWQGARETKGYGILYKSRNPVKWHKAHRLSWELHFGEIPKGLFICHSCDNPPCVNPKHLFSGTNKDNIQDAWEKGRFNDRRGEKNGRAKLKEKDIMRIKELRKTGLSQQKIADMFNVSQVRISMILSNKTWKHIEV